MPSAGTDHDLLITLHEQVKGIRGDIKEIKDGIKFSVDDHEKRLRLIEKNQWKWSGIAGILGAGITIILNIIISVILQRK